MDTIQKCENTFFSIAKGSTSASGKKKKKIYCYNDERKINKLIYWQE